MGHRRFTKEKQISTEHPYTRTPNPNARNYFDEMAPEVLEAANRERETMRDAVSKRMGELLLRGVTMLDAYCQTCNGILMQDRNGVQSCVTCDIYAEKTQTKSKISKAIQHLGEKEDSEEPFEMHKAVVVSLDRSSTEQELKHVPAPSKKTPPSQQTSKPSPMASNSSISLPGYAAAVRAVDNKLAWAAERLATTTDVAESRELLALISEAMATIRGI